MCVPYFSFYAGVLIALLPWIALADDQNVYAGGEPSGEVEFSIDEMMDRVFYAYDFSLHNEAGATFEVYAGILLFSMITVDISRNFPLDASGQYYFQRNRAFPWDTF